MALSEDVYVRFPVLTSPKLKASADRLALEHDVSRSGLFEAAMLHFLRLSAGERAAVIAGHGISKRRRSRA